MAAGCAEPRIGDAGVSLSFFCSASLSLSSLSFASLTTKSGHFSFVAPPKCYFDRSANISPQFYGSQLTTIVAHFTRSCGIRRTCSPPFHTPQFLPWVSQLLFSFTNAWTLPTDSNSFAVSLSSSFNLAEPPLFFPLSFSFSFPFPYPINQQDATPRNE